MSVKNSLMWCIWSTEHELDKAENGMPWLDSWEELKEIVRKSTWERFESKLNEEQREIVHLIGRFNAFYGIEEPNTKILYHGAWILLQGRRTRCSIHMEK